MDREVERQVYVPEALAYDWPRIEAVESIFRKIAAEWDEELVVWLRDAAGRLTGETVSEIRAALDNRGRPQALNLCVGQNRTGWRSCELHLDELDQYVRVAGTTIAEADTIVTDVLAVTGSRKEQEAQKARRRKRSRMGRWALRHGEAIVVGVLSSIVGALLYAWWFS